MLWLNYRTQRKHLATQLWWVTAQLVFLICLGPINPLNGLLAVCSRWCAMYETVTMRVVSVNKKVDLKFIQVNILKNMARMTRRLYVLVMSHMHLRVNLHSAVAWMSRNSLLKTDMISKWHLSDCNGIRLHNHVVCKRTLNHLYKLAKWLNLTKWLSVHLRPKWLWVRI